MTTVQFVIEASSQDKSYLDSVTAEVEKMLNGKEGLSYELDTSQEIVQGMEAKEVVLTILLSITANLATDGLKKVYDDLNKIEVTGCAVEVIQLPDDEDEIKGS